MQTAPIVNPVSGVGDPAGSARYPRPVMSTDGEIPHEYEGWWRITETSTWGSDDIDMIGTALISFTGSDDRLRMFVLLARVKCMATKSGVSFMWQGAWEYDQMSGTGSVKLRKDGRLAGKFKIEGGDDSTFRRRADRSAR